MSYKLETEYVAELREKGFDMWMAKKYAKLEILQDRAMACEYSELREVVESLIQWLKLKVK